MKHLYFFISLIILLWFTSCDLETSGNGDLDGMWHIERMDSVNNGVQTDLKGERLYWSFQHKLLQLDDKNWIHPSLLLRFEKRGSILLVHDPYLYNREEGDEPLTEPTLLKPFGINMLRDTFTIEKLKGENFVITSKTVRLHMKRF